MANNALAPNIDNVLSDYVYAGRKLKEQRTNNMLNPQVQSAMTLADLQALKGAPTQRTPTLGERIEGLSYAAGEGFSDQLRGLQQLVTHPVQSAKDIYAGVKTVVQNPRQALQAASEGIKQATSSPEAATRFIAQNFSPVELATGLSKVGTMRQIFVGKGSKSWDQAAHEAALKLEKEGATPEQIWEQTGNWRGPDGEWRQEISDEAMEFKNDLYEKSPERQGTIEVLNKLAKETISHPEAMTAYPELQNVKTSLTARHEPRTPDYWLSGGLRTTPIIPYFTKAPEYHLNIDAKLKNVAQDAYIHEMQHAIQDIEGFSSGGSPTHYFEEARAMLEKNPDFNSQHEAIKQMQVIELANQIYRSLAGEAEARAAAVRRNMTAEQRRATFPEKSYDIPISQIRLK